MHESDAVAASDARARGYDVWQASPADAPFVVPASRRFDLIFLDPAAADPLGPGDLLTALRRLRQMLRPRGLIVLSGPNLDSALLDLFGPTWAGWQPGRRRTFLGRRGLGRLAGLAEPEPDPLPHPHAARRGALRRRFQPPRTRHRRRPGLQSARPPKTAAARRTSRRVGEAAVGLARTGGRLFLAVLRARSAPSVIRRAAFCVADTGSSVGRRVPHSLHRPEVLPVRS